MAEFNNFFLLQKQRGYLSNSLRATEMKICKLNDFSFLKWEIVLIIHNQCACTNHGLFTKDNVSYLSNAAIYVLSDLAPTNRFGN